MRTLCGYATRSVQAARAALLHTYIAGVSYPKPRLAGRYARAKDPNTMSAITTALVSVVCPPQPLLAVRALEYVTVDVSVRCARTTVDVAVVEGMAVICSKPSKKESEAEDVATAVSRRSDMVRM